MKETISKNHPAARSTLNVRSRPDWTYEDEHSRSSSPLVAGVDEVGRGALAGPVVAAAVVFPPTLSRAEPWIARINDSKKLNPASRLELANIITNKCYVGIGVISPHVIDAINIRQASLLAMKKAVNSLRIKPERVIIDGIDCIGLGIEELSIIGGDTRSVTIAAASIIAKVRRDKILTDLDIHFGGYGFSEHMGYGTRRHIEAINELGPCIVHRFSFKPIKNALARA